MAKIQTKWSVEEENNLRIYWPEKSRVELENIFNRTYLSIKGKAKLLNIKKVDGFKFKKKIHKLLEDTNEKYYWLGFILADGHFSKNLELKITLSIKDDEHLIKLSNFLEYDNIKYNKSKQFVYLSVRDSNTISLLKDMYSIDTNKTKNPCDISSINSKDKFMSFFIGFFDGDGCVLKNRKNIPNGIRIQIYNTWIHNLQVFSNRLNEYLDIDSRSYIDSQGYARFVIFKKSSLKKIKEEAIRLRIPFLNRKLGTI